MWSKIWHKKNKALIILVAIMVVGIFLRIYHFHDWLLFGPDQVRDAKIVNNAIATNQPILLGAQAGNTKFHLGPIYYQMQYLSEKVFGQSPEKLAYPDLLFSILTIPLLFFFFRKIFSERISLFLTFLYSISYFSIFAARFAVNSNALSFFFILLLYGLMELMLIKDKNKVNWIWPALVGAALGIGIQLHALAFVVMPAIVFVCFGYLLVKRHLSLKTIFIAFSFFLLMNYGQIRYEFTAAHSNIANFFGGAGSQSEGLIEAGNMFTTVLCQARADANQLTAFDSEKYCSRGVNLLKTTTDVKKGNFLTLSFLISLLLTFGGYWLWVKNINRDKENKKKLVLLLVSNLLFLLAFIPIVGQAEVHYFNFVFFVPFIMLGLLLKTIAESKINLNLKKISIGLIIILVLASNFYYLSKDAIKYITLSASNDERCILGEIIPIANFMVNKSQGAKQIYLDGDRISTHRYADAIGFLTMQSGIELLKLREDNNQGDQKLPFFYIKIVNNEQEKQTKILSNRQVIDSKRNGNLVIYNLNNNKN